MKVLLEKKAEINVVDRDKVTPLHRATVSNNADIVKVLLEKKAEINVIDGIYGATPLHWAAIGGNVKIVRALLKRKAEINIVDQSRATPLHYAAENGRNRVLKILLKKGANPSLRNNCGKTPRDLTRDDDIKQLLERGERRQLLHLVIVSITSSLIAVFGTAVAIWYVEKGETAAVVIYEALTVIVFMLAIGVMAYKIPQPMTSVNVMQIEGRHEREGRS